jgi:hypothetical protein
MPTPNISPPTRVARKSRRVRGSFLRRSAAPLWGRVAAILGVASATVHLAALPDLPLSFGLIMGAATAVCAGCVPPLWRRPTPTTWLAAGLMNMSMLGIHGYAMSTVHAGASGAPMHEHMTMHMRGDGWDLMRVASLIAATEVTVATAALVGHLAQRHKTRLLSPSLSTVGRTTQ